MSERSARIETVHSLRGLAALSVALFHFSNGNPGFFVPALLKAVGSYGWLGVEVFFVISGFVLPYSLWRAGYELTPVNFRRFVWKRIVRLEPPYFATIALILLLGYLSSISPGFRGQPFHVDFVQLGLHIGYVSAFAHFPWLNPVFWTLAVECQFYLLIALVFPMVASARRTIRTTILSLLLISSALIPSQNIVSHYLPLFACGMIAFQLHANICTRWEAVIAASAVAVMLGRMDLIVMTVALATAAFIVLVPSWTNAPLAFLGTTSYSLYLLHVPIGGRVINLFQRLEPSAAVALLGIASAMAVSIGSAYIMHRVLERPSQRYAGSIQFEHRISSPEIDNARMTNAMESLQS